MSLAQLCLTFCNPINCSMPGFLILLYLPEFSQTHVHWVSDISSNNLILCWPFSSCPQSFPASGFFFPMIWLFASGGQSIRASASASALPMNFQGRFPLGLTGLISLPSKGLATVFSSNPDWKHQFFSAQPSLWSNSHFHILLLGKPLLWLYGLLLTMWWLFFNMLSRFVIAFLPRKTVF